MKTVRTVMAALMFGGMIAVSGCAALNTAEQEEIITQTLKDQPTIRTEGRWLDANGWEYQAMGSDDND